MLTKFSILTYPTHPKSQTLRSLQVACVVIQQALLDIAGELKRLLGGPTPPPSLTRLCRKAINIQRVDSPNAFFSES